jgi:ATP-dependent RNA helicase DHX8/PRP22
MFVNELSHNMHKRLKYDYIIVDEVHERSSRTDIILGIMKEKICNWGGKLILMSATVDTSRIREYFDAGLVEIDEKGYPVDIRYEKECVADYILESYFKIREIVTTKEKEGNVLVFLPGEEDIVELYKMLGKLPQIRRYKVYSSLSDREQSLIYGDSDMRKVILSTNICETSLTIPNVRYVIDSGVFKTKIYFSSINFLGIKGIGKESAKQRTGRCNRTGPGVCYRLYTQELYEKMDRMVPEMCRCDLSNPLLLLISMKFDVLKFSFFDYPPVSGVKEALLFLLSLRCIEMVSPKVRTPEMNNLLPSDVKFACTKYGMTLLRYPLDVNLAHFYQQCINKGVRNLGAIVVSLIHQENLSFLEGAKESGSKSDLEYLTMIFKKYEKSEDKRLFCNINKLPPKGMKQALLMYNQLKGKDYVVAGCVIIYL